MLLKSDGRTRKPNSRVGTVGTHHARHSMHGICHDAV